MKRLTEQIQVYHVGDKKWIKIKGRTIHNFYDGQAVTVHKDLNSPSLFTVSDQKTGSRIASNKKTQAEAIESATAVLVSHGVEAYHKAQERALDTIYRNKGLEHMIQREQEKQIHWSRQEINDYVRRKYKTPITADMIMDINDTKLMVSHFE